MSPRKRAAHTVSAVMVAGLTSLMLAQPASAAITHAVPESAPSVQPDGTSPYPADCSGSAGDVNAHRYTRNFRTPLRKYNAKYSQRIGTVPANSKIHIYYETSDARSRLMWAVTYRGKCGYEYATSINWHKSW